MTHPHSQARLSIPTLMMMTTLSTHQILNTFHALCITKMHKPGRREEETSWRSSNWQTNITHTTLQLLLEGTNKGQGEGKRTASCVCLLNSYSYPLWGLGFDFLLRGDVIPLYRKKKAFNFLSSKGEIHLIRRAGRCLDIYLSISHLWLTGCDVQWPFRRGTTSHCSEQQRQESQGPQSPWKRQSHSIMWKTWSMHVAWRNHTSKSHRIHLGSHERIFSA